MKTDSGGVVGTFGLLSSLILGKWLLLDGSTFGDSGDGSGPLWNSLCNLPECKSSTNLAKLFPSLFN